MWTALTLDVVYSFLSYYGKGNTKLSRLKSHSANLGVQHRGFYDGLQVGYCNRFHFLFHNLGKCNCPSSIHHLQMRYNQDCHIPLPFGVLNRLSNLGVNYLCREQDWLCLPQQTWQSPLASVVSQWASPSKMLKSWLSFLVSKALRALLVSLYAWLIFLPSPLVAKLDYQSCFSVLNQGVSPYLYSTINGNRL